MMSRYRVLVVGLGKRGKHHATYFHASPSFEVVGLCDVASGGLAEIAAGVGKPRTGTDAATMARELAPDVFCFTTPPDVRSPMIRVGVESGARLIAFEKPIALTSREGIEVKELLSQRPVKAVVSHQHRYGKHYQAVKTAIAGGKIGKVHTVYGIAHGWPAHMLSHLLDYAMWFADYPRPTWVMAQAAGRHKLSDLHASPDYLGGFVQFDNGLRGIFECGGGAPDVPEVQRWWGKNRIGAIGTEGYAEVYTGNGWKAVTPDGILTGDGTMAYDQDMPGYIQDMAEWLDGGKVHPCCFERAYTGFEVVMAMLRSAARGGQVELPLRDGADELVELRRVMPDTPLRVTLEESKKEYGC
jgi:predicted dehydrogenase